MIYVTLSRDGRLRLWEADEEENQPVPLELAEPIRWVWWITRFWADRVHPVCAFGWTPERE